MTISVSLPQSDHLLLLVGSNPLPNAVAGKLLTAQGGTITLVHSKNSFPVAQRLQGWLYQKGFSNPRLKEVEESHPVSVAQSVQAELQSVHVQRVGLNYTGGTKAMSVHAYRAVEQWANAQHKQGRNVETVFSYLDARKLEIIFDPADPSSGEYGRREYVGLEVPLTLTDLLDLHGWTLKHAPTTRPLLLDSACSLASIHTQRETAEIWRVWLRGELLNKATRLEQLRVRCRRAPDDQECTVEQPTRKWWNKSKLKEVILQCPTETALQPLAENLKRETQQTDAMHLGNAARKCGYSDPVDFCKWLDGLWLESALLQTLHDCTKANTLHDVSMNLEPASGSDNPTSFEFDVVAMRGYQLFAFSCSTDTESVQGGTDRLKKKLFEAAIRARQLGGDEARVALVCCSDNPDKLQREMRHVFAGSTDGPPEQGNEHIKVFGCRDLPDLAGRVSQWIQHQSGEK